MASRKTNRMEIQIRASPRFQNLPNDGGNSNFEKILNATESTEASNTNVSPRFQNLPNVSATNSVKTPDTRLSPNSKNDKTPNATDSAKTSKTRVSPRFQNLPNIEKISDATDSRETSNTRVSLGFQNLPNTDNSNIEDATDLKNTSNTRVSPRPNSGNSNIEKIQDVPDSRKTSNTRVSPRLQSIPLEKRPYYGSFQKSKTLNDSREELMVKKHKVGNAKRETASNGSVTVEKHVADSRDNGPNAIHGASVSMAVRDKLRLFNKYYLQFAKEEDERCNKNSSASDHEIVNGTAKDINSSNNYVLTSKKNNRDSNNLRIIENQAGPSHGTQEVPAKEDACEGHVNSPNRRGPVKQRRPDLKAISEMLKKNEVLCHEKCFGDLPGIEVGNRFYSRAEMVAVGLHKQLEKGIDCVGSPYVKSEFPLAAAIVLSGQYEDDFDNKEEIVYTGEGGNDLLGNKRQVKDQVMLRGNLALKNNKEQSVPVRVIRGHKCDDSYSKTLYIYDGLYKVTDYWEEQGKSGFEVLKYRLKRLEGQCNLSSQNKVHFVRGKVSRAHQDLSRIVCKDISNGQENKCIPAFNLYNSSVAPAGFKYIKSIEVAKNVSIPPDAPGCNCRGKCTNPKSCVCARLNGGDFPYVSRDGSRLLEAKDVVFECGPNCGCGTECVNRASQQGLKYHLEIYHTKDKGWAVRSLDFIPSGAPVCEYVGILRKSDELNDISENDYIFEIDCWHTINGIGGRERRLGDVSLPMSNLVSEDGKSLESDPEPEFCIDASSSGNIARFINHSCDPNLFVQCILSSHHDLRLARIVLFAADNIPRMQELTYDYNYAIDSVIGPDGETKQLPCFCGTGDCRKRLY